MKLGPNLFTRVQIIDWFNKKNPLNCCKVQNIDGTLRIFSKIWEYMHYFTMLQKFSKCEVKAWLCWNLIILPPLIFYEKSNFGELKRSINVIFGNFRDSRLWTLVNLGLKSCSNLLKSKFRPSKVVKNYIFWTFWIRQNLISQNIGVAVKWSNFNKIKH